MLKAVQKGDIPIYHKFPVYSKIDDYENVIPKYVKCNNCDTLHYVFEVCKSELKLGKDEVTFVNDVNDIKVNIPDKLLSVLEKNSVGLAIYEEVLDAIENNYFPLHIVLQREVVDDVVHVKSLTINGKDSFKITNNFISNVVRGEEKWVTQ